MINIIDHFWQSELKNFSILPTVIKFTNNTPKSYFYSQKQLRILRKKEQTIQSALQFLGTSIKTNQNYFLVIQKAVNEVQFSLNLNCQIEALLNKNSANFAVMRLQQQANSTLIIECSFDAQAKVGIQPLMIFDKEKSLWSSNVQQLIISSSLLQSYMLEMWKELPKACLSASKCRKISLILSISQTLGKINILWCNELSFDKKDFYQIHYSYRIKQPGLVKAPNLQLKPQISYQKLEVKHNIEIKPKSSYKEESTQTKEPLIKLITCNGCGRQVIEQRSKQVQTSDVITLRRRNKMSIMGIKDPYLLVCEKCYYAIDQ